MFCIDKYAVLQHATVAQSLIEPLKREVYSVINEFLRNAEYIILNCMKEALAVQQEGHAFEYNTVLDLFNTNRSKFDEKTATQIEGLLRDVHYIVEMKKLEAVFFNG